MSLPSDPYPDFSSPSLLGIRKLRIHTPGTPSSPTRRRVGDLAALDLAGRPQSTPPLKNPRTKLRRSSSCGRDGKEDRSSYCVYRDDEGADDKASPIGGWASASDKEDECDAMSEIDWDLEAHERRAGVSSEPCLLGPVADATATS